MDTLQPVVAVAHTLIALLIIGFVLLQRGKGADAGAAFGAGASGTVFGARGSSSFFSRVTAILATLFFVSSLTLAYFSSQRTTAPESLLEDAAVLEEQLAPEVSGGDEAAEFPRLPEIGEDPAADDGEIPVLEPQETGVEPGEQ